MKKFLQLTLPFAVRLVPLAIGLFFVYLPFSLNMKSLHLKEVGVQTEGIIANGNRDGEGSTKIHYIVNGKTYTNYAPGLGRSNQGQEVLITYDPNHPSQAMVNLDYYNKTRLIVIFLFGLLFTVVGIYAMYSITIGPASKIILNQKVTA